MIKQMKRGFTLVELLTVMGVLVVLGTIVYLTLNPVEAAKQSRDTRRVADINTIQSAIESALTSDPNVSLGGVTNTVFVSIPDPQLVGDATSSCYGFLGMPALPSGWQYQCVSPDNLRKTNGKGWIPINFDSLPAKSALSSLPIDPSNTAADRRFYTYIPNGGLTAKLESQKNIDSIGSKDGGNDNALYELGKIPNPKPLDPIIVPSTAMAVAQTTATLNVFVTPNGSDTTVWFRYIANSSPMGCNDVFGTATVAQSVGSGYSSVPYAQNVTGLSPATTYYYCAIAQNAVGKVAGPLQSFITP